MSEPRADQHVRRVWMVLPNHPNYVGARVEIDGVDVAGSLRGLNLSARVGELPRLRLDVIAKHHEVDGEMRVDVPPATREALIALGWTPPEERT